MASYKIIPERSVPNGLTLNFDAPFSGQLEERTIEKAFAKLPEAIKEATESWESIHDGRSTGLAPMFDDGPLDNAVREGTWRPELQIRMPTAGGLPGSKGMQQIWQHTNVTTGGEVGFNESAKANGEGISSSFKNLIQIFETTPKETISVFEVPRRETEEQNKTQTQRFSLYGKVQHFDLTLEDESQHGNGESQHGNGSEFSRSIGGDESQRDPKLQSPTTSKMMSESQFENVTMHIASNSAGSNEWGGTQAETP